LTHQRELSGSTVLGTLKDDVLRLSKDMASEDFRLRGLFLLDLTFQPDPAERRFRYEVVVAQTTGQGACYSAETGIDLNPISDELIGKDCRETNSSIRHSSVELAVLDAVYSAFPNSPEDSVLLDGPAFDKSVQRANIVVDEVTRLLCRGSDLRGKEIVNIGVVGNFIRTLRARRAIVYATDLDQSIIGREIAGVQIENGELNEDRIADADLALVTGMVLSTNTVDEIIQWCHQYDTKLIIFAETGANFAAAYCRMGVDTAVSEPFPFYIFSGLTKINIYRASRN